MFKGFDEKDGAELYETKEEAINRVKMLIAWNGDPTQEIMVHRKRIPLWLAHLVQDTPLVWIGYKKLNT